MSFFSLIIFRLGLWQAGETSRLHAVTPPAAAALWGSVQTRPLCTYSSQKNVPTDGVEARCQSCVTVKPPREPRGVGVAAVCATACRRGDRQALAVEER